ncbi:glycosyl transferase family 2 [Coriobacterium glomerans PW2]|uniref:Glycosyl transferase family 2 n=1 Tax=Coriobacterium glomerans (strain ATCC 49209 / DSM 20642 / JCM 10262 / PW2) TaxID=700015 RepID=F2N838_CORGP|nr:glycosyltransferase [Coriobacterium glomerans]AEB07221.1 glycosyl transferase family 2 [Coriobacterium glomerans PW2]
MGEVSNAQISCSETGSPETEALVSCLAACPLTEADVRRGRALRVTSCVRSADDDLSSSPQTMVWSVICLRKAWRREVPPRLSGISGIPHPVAPARLVSWDVLVRGRRWCATEYAVPVPIQCRAFSLRLGIYVRRIDAVESSRQIDAYFEQIRNILVDDGYKTWLAGDRRRAQRLAPPQTGPLMSIVVPAYNTPPAYLSEMIASVIQQTYARWELVIINASPENEAMAAVLADLDDDRIIVVDAAENLGIAGNTNLGIAASHGAYVSFLDHDDFIEPHALALMVREIQHHEGGLDLIYCDEDSFDERGKFVLPLFKPGANIDLLYSNNYVIHWLTVSRRMLDAIDRSESELDGAQDYDLTLKVFERSSAICRIPHVLYHWRIHAGSTNINPDSKPYAADAGRRAICFALRRREIPAQVRPTDVAYTYEAELFDASDDKRRLQLLLDGSASDEVSAVIDDLEQAGVDVSLRSLARSRPDEENLANVVSETISESDLVLFLNGDIRLDVAGIRRLMSYFQRREVFAVSPRVVRADGLMDFAGAIVRPDGTLGRLNRLLPAADGGYLGRAHRSYDAAVLNGECCMVRGGALKRIGLDARFSTLEYLLADACLKARARRLLSAYVPYVTARLRVARSLIVEPACMWPSSDGARLISVHHDVLGEGDPSHNPNFDPNSLYYRLNRHRATQE